MGGTQKAVLICALVAPACTLAFDPDEFPGLRDAPSVVIEIVDPNADQVVGLVPPDDGDAIVDQPARTTHELRLRIGEVLDGRGEPVGEFRVEWERRFTDPDNDVVVTETVAGSRIAPALTRKHETWTATVTPVAGDLEGPSESQSVTIANTSPTVRSLGLTTYAPMVGDLVEALVDAPSDEDGDELGFRFRWYLGEEKSAATLQPADGKVIQVDETADAPATLFLEAEVFDTDGDVAVTTTDVRVWPDEPTWYPLLPNALGSGFPLFASVFIAPDPARGRVLQFDRGLLWEYDVTSFQRWVPLLGPRENAPTVFTPDWVIDEDGDRLIVHGGFDFEPNGFPMSFDSSTEVSVLSLARGEERWSRLQRVPNTPLPNIRGFPRVFDSARQRILVFGSVSEEFEAESRVWAMHLNPDNTYAWSELEVTGNIPPPRVGAMAFFDPDRARDEVLLVGGFDEGSIDGAGRRLWRVTFPDTDSVSFQEAFSQGQPPLGGASVAVDAERRVALFASGITSRGNKESRKFYEMSLDGDRIWREVGELHPDANAFFGGAVGHLPERDAFVLVGGRTSVGILGHVQDDDFQLSILEGGVHRVLEKPGLTRPDQISDTGSLSHRVSDGVNHVKRLVAISSPNSVDHVWSFDGETAAWLRTELLPDPMRGHPTWGGARNGSEHRSLGPSGSAIDIIDSDGYIWSANATWKREDGMHPSFGGLGPKYLCVSNGVDWVLTNKLFRRNQGGTWTEIVGFPSLSEPACFGFGPWVRFFGGAAPVAASDMYEVAAVSWEMFPSTEFDPVPAPRVGHTLAVTKSIGQPARAFLFGGTNSAGLRNDAWVLDEAPLTTTGWAWEMIDGGSESLREMPFGRPSPRREHLSAWDEARRSLLVVGGSVVTGVLRDRRDDVWELRGVRRQ